MRVAFVLLVALACVVIVSAGSGKDKKNREGKENKKAESWTSKKDNREGKNKNGRKEERSKKEEKQRQGDKQVEKDKKRSKREETQQPPRQQEVKEGKQYDKQKNEKSKKNEKRPAQTEPVKQEEPSKKKSKKVETPVKEESKKNKKVQKKEEEVVEEEVTIETEETVEPAVLDEVEGECPQEPTEECNQEPEVTLSSGSKMRGKKGKTQAGKDTAEFTGMPYAEPPVAQDRLKEPVLKTSWSGVLMADTPANDCLQWSHFSYAVIGSEDCLYLNVYTPRLPKKNGGDEELMPVVVYIHGGAFMFFSSALGGPRYLLDEDIVLVTLNYRLGPLGFFSLGDDSVAGNLGLRDQMTALKWVQLNIKSFGGDPQRVTISGMSAGGASVHYHLLSPLSKGLFSKAISLSGTALNPWAEAESVVDKSMDLVRRIGCEAPTSEEMVSCLRSRPAEKLVATCKEMQVWQYNPISPWAPSPEPKTASNPFLPDSPINIILDGKSQHVPWLVSWTNQEGGYPCAEFVFDESLLDHLDKNWLSLAPHLLEFNHTAPPANHNHISNAIKKFYLDGKPSNHPQFAASVIDMASDRLFLEGIAEAIKGHVDKYDSPIYTYRFSHLGQDSVSRALCHCNRTLDGACHADDVGYLLEAMSPVLRTQEEFQLSKDMVGLWHSFITTGVPVFRGQALPRVSRPDEPIPFLDIGQGGKTSLLADSDLGKQAFWTSLGLSDLSRRNFASPLRDEL